MAIRAQSIETEALAPLDLSSSLGADSELISRLQAGDEDAYETLVRCYGGRMLSTARRFFSCEQEAADAVQDAFISAFKAIGKFHGQSQLATWLHRIVVNSCLMRRRSRDRHPTIAIESLLPQFDAGGHHLHRIPASCDSPSDQLTTSEVRTKIREGIDRLPPAYREV